MNAVKLTVIAASAAAFLGAGAVSTEAVAAQKAKGADSKCAQKPLYFENYDCKVWYEDEHGYKQGVFEFYQVYKGSDHFGIRVKPAVGYGYIAKLGCECDARVRKIHRPPYVNFKLHASRNSFHCATEGDWGLHPVNRGPAGLDGKVGPRGGIRGQIVTGKAPKYWGRTAVYMCLPKPKHTY